MDNRGFTLIELMVAMTISLVVMAAIYTTFQAQTRSWVAQQEMANLQQNLRAGMYHLERAIRMAGYDPQNSRAFGFVSNFTISPYTGAGCTTDGDDIAFTVDADNNGTIDANANELVCYRRNPTTNVLQKFLTSGTGDWQPVAYNITSIAFTYLDDVNVPTTDLSDIQTVQITLTAQSSHPTITSPPRTLTSRVRCRNL